MSWTRTRAQIANHARNHPGEETPPDLVRDHAAARLEDYVRRVIDRAPPLTSEQIERIAGALTRRPPQRGA